MNENQLRALVMAIIHSGCTKNPSAVYLQDQANDILRIAGATQAQADEAELEAARKKIDALEAQLAELQNAADNAAQAAVDASDDAEAWRDRMREVVNEWKAKGMTPELGELIDAAQTALSLTAAIEAHVEEPDGEQNGAGL